MPEETMYFVTDTWGLKWLTGTTNEGATDDFESVPQEWAEEDANAIAVGLNTEAGFNRFSVGTRPKP